MTYDKLEVRDKKRMKYSVELNMNCLKIGDNEIKIRCGTKEM
jgi:hypothetical protein